MSKIVTVPLTENFLSHVVDYIYRYYERGGDLSRLAVIFGGRRPSLFIKRDLAARIGKAFVPPRFFTIDEWMSYVAFGQKKAAAASLLDHAYTIYQLAKQQTPQLCKARESFAQFLPWAMEILRFIEQLDLEDVSHESLKTLKEHAQIGLSVPADITTLLVHVGSLRQAYHQELDKRALASRGYQYLLASRCCHQCDLSAFDEILFCNLFYLHHTENKVIKDIYDRMPVVLFMQGDQRRWPALNRIAQSFGGPILEGPEIASRHFDLKIYEALDAHTQAGLVTEILRTVKDPASTVIVLPSGDALLPLLTSIGSVSKAFNVSMGYPLKRSALYTLLMLIIEAQDRRRNQLYYAKDYQAVLQHPLVRGLNLGYAALSQILVTHINRALTGEMTTEISGCLFLDLDHVLGDGKLLSSIEASLASMGMPMTLDAIKKNIQLMHKAFFRDFEGIQRPIDLAEVLGRFVDFMQQKSAMDQYPLNTSIAMNLQAMANEFLSCRFAQETFEPRDLLRVLQEQMSNQMVAFAPSPLKGLQILGLFETRALNFKHVIMLDVNEGCLPNLNMYEPLIPREVMILLSLGRLELEEEIQRYGFMRLISGAEDVHLIYQHNNSRGARSRFLEELIWEQERKTGLVGCVDIGRGDFEVCVSKSQRMIAKTPAMMRYLKNFKFSASSVDAYLKNPYFFYCQYVLGLKLKEDLLEAPEDRHIGIFIHDLFQEAFKVFIGKKPVIDEGFKKYFQKIYETRFAASFGKAGRSDTFLMETVLRTRLQRFLTLEALRCESKVKKILFIEKKFEDVLPFGGQQVHWTYRIDRVDEMLDGSILVLDYKTGGANLRPAAVFKELVWNREYLYNCVKSFQMPLYLHYVRRQYPEILVNCGLYHLRTMNVDFFLNQDQMKDSQPIIASYAKALDFIMAEIFNLEIPFVDQ